MDENFKLTNTNKRVQEEFIAFIMISFIKQLLYACMYFFRFIVGQEGVLVGSCVVTPTIYAQGVGMSVPKL